MQVLQAIVDDRHHDALARQAAVPGRVHADIFAVVVLDDIDLLSGIERHRFHQHRMSFWAIQIGCQI